MYILNVEKILQEAENNSWDKNALNCSQCPKEKCPEWVDNHVRLVDDTGKEVVRHLKGCGKKLAPIMYAALWVEQVQTQVFIRSVLNQEHEKNTIFRHDTLQNFSNLKQILQGILNLVNDIASKIVFILGWICERKSNANTSTGAEQEKEIKRLNDSSES